MKEGMHVESLHPPAPEFPISSVTKIIEDLFKNELSGHKWKDLTLDESISLIDKKVEQFHIAPNDRHLILLRRQLRDCITREGFISLLGDFLLGESL